MKKQLQKKHKIMIGAGAGLLGAAAVATPLAIVLTQNVKHNNPLNIDQTYGLDKAQYNKMKTNLLNAYSAELDAERVEDKEARMAKLTRQFNGLDNAVKQSNSANTYYSATSALLAITKDINKGLAKGVVLTRESRAN
ncbi:MAG: hypothetical protein MJ200_04040 [Mycoplasmoidaceae bacterium]|nr:hypothetical protein [Mycoplasmoidaceae bacterium]